MEGMAGVMDCKWRYGLYLCFVLLVLQTTACGNGEKGSGARSAADLIEVDLEKSDPERLLRYYFGGYASQGGSDPFQAGLVIEEEGRFFVDLAVLDASHAGMGASLKSAAIDGKLVWEALADFLNDTYYEARNLPPTLADLRAEVPYLVSDTAWLQVDIDGVMTQARRHVYVEKEAIRFALSQYREKNEQLLYPQGTTMVGEHYLEGQHIETTVMRKRKDGFWDFFTYDESGKLAGQTRALPRSLKTPTQCVGCHFGNKQFEPERSFPGKAAPGPHGPRALYVDEAWRDREVVTFFDEHRKRSDTLLGLYATLFVSKLRADRRAGQLPAEDARLLEDLSL